MRYYLLIILLLVALIIGVNALILPKKFNIELYQIIIYVIASVIMVIILDGLCAFVIHHLPNKWFRPDKKKYRVGSFEKAFYRLIKIRKWKDLIPEIGELTCSFGKDKLKNPNDLEYLYAFLIEMGMAEEIHFISCIIGFLIIFILPLRYAFYIGIPISIINSFFNILSALIQRYNRPKLLILYHRKQRTY